MTNAAEIAQLSDSDAALYGSQFEDPLIQEDEFAQAYRRGFNATLRFVRSMGANVDTAEEVAQAAWVRGWQCRSQLMNKHAAGQWVNSIARNLYWSVVSMENRYSDLSDCPVSSNVVRTLEASDALGVCSATESKMLKMFYFEGYTTLEIAEREGLCPTTVRVRLMRIRRSLRERFTSKGTETVFAKAA